MKKQGVLIYDDVIGRMDIRFGPLDYYGGLHCGERLEVLLDGEWIPTRIELAFSAWEADVLPLNYTREGLRIIVDPLFRTECSLLAK